MTGRTFSRAIVTVVVIAALAACGRNDPDKFVASAEAYLAKNDYRAAIIELKNALNKAPENARVRFMLGKAMLDNGDPVAAATELRKALALKYAPDDVYPLLARALVQARAPKSEFADLASAPVQGPHAKAELAAQMALAYMTFDQPKDAKAQVDAALALEPDNAAARLAQAQLALIDNNLPGALEVVDAIVAKAPQNVDALLLKGEIESALGRRAAAIRTFEQVVELRPEALRARYALVSTYVQTRQLDKATPHIEVVKKLAPGDPRTSYAIAFDAFARGDNPAALEAIQKALQGAPNFLPARYLSGLIDLQRGAYATAESSLRAVVTMAPNEDGARIALAQAYLRRDQPSKARDTLEPVLRRAPENTSVLRLAAEIQLALRNAAGSADYLARANALDKGDIAGRVRMAEVRLAQGDTAQGVSDLEALAASEPDKREPDQALIGAFLRSGEYTKALAAADALIKKQPKSATAQSTKGNVYMAMGNLKDARAAFDKALALDADLTVATFNLARIDVAEAKYEEAKKKFQQILAKTPKSEGALIGLAEVALISGAPPAEVTAALDRAVAANPESVPARLALIKYAGMQKDWKAALNAALAAQAAIPDSPPILEALAGVQVASGGMNQAVETYARLANLQPENPLPLMRMAGVHAGLKDYRSATTALKNALNVAPANPSIWIALAAMYMESNQVDAGFAEARRLQKDKPALAAGFGIEGELYGAQKRFPEAVTSYRAAIAKQPLPFSVTRLHTLLTLTGKTDEAASIAQKWVKEHPKDTQVRTYLGQQSLVKGDFKTAAQYFRAALEYDRNNVVLLNNLAWSLSELNDPSAREYAERAYRLAPNVAEVANTYGWILVQRGDAAQGVAMLRRAVTLAPADPEKRLRLAKALIKGGDKAGARTELDIVSKGESIPARAQAEQLLKDL